MLASIEFLEPALILLPKPPERFGHRKYTVPAPNPVSAAPSDASQAVRRNDRLLTCGFLGAGRGEAGVSPVLLAMDTVPCRRGRVVRARRTSRWSRDAPAWSRWSSRA